LNGSKEIQQRSDGKESRKGSGMRKSDIGGDIVEVGLSAELTAREGITDFNSQEPSVIYPV
jgi:hypothetical protein